MEPTMSFSAPVANAPAEVTQAPVSPEVPTTSFAPEVPVVAPQQMPAFENINVYAESISPSSSNDPSQSVFDIVLSVNWTCPATGEYKTAKMLKTVSFCKQSLADQTSSQPVTFVESKKEEKKDNSKLLKGLRELAGVPGKGTFV
jgi:hypothetical protein